MIEFAYIVNCYTAKLPNFQHISQKMKNIDKSPHLGNSLTNCHEIWHGDTY